MRTMRAAKVGHSLITCNCELLMARIFRRKIKSSEDMLSWYQFQGVELNHA